MAAGARRQTPSQILDAGMAAKEEGNRLFKAGDYRAAVWRYKQAILSSRSLVNCMQAMAVPASMTGRRLLTPEEESRLKGLTQSLHANLSACYLKQDDWEKAVKYAAVVLESDPGNVKSMLRLGQAYHMLGDLLGADKILTKAASLHTKGDGLGKALRETLKIVRGKMRGQDRHSAVRAQAAARPVAAMLPTQGAAAIDTGAADGQTV